MATTAHLGVTLVETSQAQKEVTVNTALARIDAVLNMAALDRDLATPPGSPAAGDVYIVGGSPTGDWSGRAGQIAYYDQIWRFIVPREGMRLQVADEDAALTYNGSGWVTEESLAHSVIVTASSGSAVTLDLQRGTSHDVTLTAGTVTLTFSNPPPGGKTGVLTLLLRQDGTGNRTVTWPGGTRWPGGTVPTLSTAANRIDLFRLLTFNGGTNWYGQTLGIHMA